jgi:FMN phosphatase YigB (HAD superfamily)
VNVRKRKVPPRKTTLLILDFDSTLYDSPHPPNPNDRSWWFHAHSLDGFGAPGYDRRWILDVVTPMRKVMNRPDVISVLLTARAQHVEMVERVTEMLDLADLPFDHYQFRPVTVQKTNAAFKAEVVQKWLLANPWIEQVVFYEDRPENLISVGEIVKRLGRKYIPVLVPPQS